MNKPAGMWVTGNRIGTDKPGKRGTQTKHILLSES